MKYLAALALSFVVTFGVTAGYAQAPGQEEKVQHVRLAVGDDGYVVTPSNVTKGVPVKMRSISRRSKAARGRW